MKLFKIIWLELIIILGLSACGSNKESQDEYIFKEDFYNYQLESTIYSYDVSRNGKLYCVVSTGHSDTDYLEQGESYQKMLVLNEVGEEERSISIPSGTSWMRISDDEKAMYYIDTSDYANPKLCKYNFEEAEVHEIYSLPAGIFIEQFEITKDQAFITARRMINDDESTIISDSNSKKVIAKISLSEGEYNELELTEPYSFSLTMDQNVMIYATDSQGYYFIEYDVKNQEYRNKVYHQLLGLSSFYICNENNDFIYVKWKSNSRVLTYGSIQPEEPELELVPDYENQSSLLCKYGNTYSLSNDGKDILRIKNSAYINDTKTIRLLSPMNYNGHNPFGCGYRMQNQFKDNDELALSVLARDSDYDLFFMSSWEEVSHNIKEKGSFYPLNEVEGVMEYLDACFPYIKEAAVNDEGDVWMIPIRIDIPFLLCNESMCAQYDIPITETIEFDEFYKLLRQLNFGDATKELFYINDYYYTRYLLNQYVNSSQDLHTELFQTLSIDLKYLNDGNSGSDLASNEYYRNGNQFLFLYKRNLYELSDSNQNGDFHIMSVPSIEKTDEVMAVCHFICVNPSSKNLKVTLQYVSDLCNYLITQSDSFMLADRENYENEFLTDELYELNQKGRIYFSYPDEILIDNFSQYLEGKMELEDVIAEADRRLEIYQNE